MLRHLSLRNQLILFSVACLLPLLVVALLIVTEASDAGREQVLDAQAGMAEVVAGVLATTITDNQKVLQELASFDRVREMQPVRAKEGLDQFGRAHPNVYGFFLLDQKANLIASTGLDPEQFRVRTPFVETIDRSLKLGEPGVSTALETPDARVIALTVPVRANDQAEGAPIGVLGSLLSVERLGSAVLPFARGDTLIAVIADGQVVATQGADPGVDALVASTLAPFASNGGQPAPVKPDNLSYQDETGKERFAVYAPVPGSSWGVLVTHPSPSAYAPNQAMVTRSLVAIAAASLVTLALGALVSELVARPLRQLRDRAMALVAGDVVPLEPVQGGADEITEISESFGVMASRFGEQMHDLEQSREAGVAQAAQLRDLNRRTVRLQEDERRRIAGEIHDAVSPLITGALYQARALRLGDPGDEERPTARQNSALDNVSDLLAQSMEELHGVVFALRPPDLDDIGVVAAIERYIAQVQRSGMTVRLEAQEDPPALTPEVRLAIYRIVQEALHNALRHAAADEAVVSFETTDEVLRVTIRDNGAGFNPEIATRPTALGLLSMGERAAAIGATFAVQSSPGDGTTVIMERRIDPETVALPQLAQVDELPERVTDGRKRISA